MRSRPEALCAEFTGVLSWNEYHVMTYCPSEVRPVAPLLDELELLDELLLDELELDELLELEELEVVVPPQLALSTVMLPALNEASESVE